MKTGRFSRVLTLAASVTAAGLIAGVPLAAHAAAAPARAHTALHEIDITGMGRSFHVTAKGAQAGLTKIVFASNGPDAHQAQLFLLKVSFNTFKRDLLGGKPSATDGADGLPWGGAAITPPGRTQVVEEALQGGTYAVVCFVTGADGVPHFAMGMITSFSVKGHLSARQLAAQHPAEQIAGVITAHNMTYTMPAVLHSGSLYAFRDTDAMDPHELNVAKLLPGKTAADVIAWAHAEAGPPPFIPAGGAGGWAPHGLTTWFRLHAAPGKYVAFCLIPDDKAPHLPHAAMGMVVAFTVR